MALANKKYTRFYSTSGTDADKISDDKLLKVKVIWEADVASGANLDLLEHPDLGPLIYQMQQMQDEFDSVRDHVVNDIVGQQGPKGDTGATGATGATGPQGPAGNNGSNGSNGSDGADGAAGADGKDAGLYKNNKGVEFVFIPVSAFVGVNYAAYSQSDGTTISNSKGALHAMWPGIDGKTVDKVHVHTDSAKAIPGSVAIARTQLGTTTLLTQKAGSSDTDIDITDWLCAVGESLSITITPASTTVKIHGATLTLK